MLPLNPGMYGGDPYTIEFGDLPDLIGKSNKFHSLFITQKVFFSFRKELVVNFFLCIRIPNSMYYRIIQHAVYKSIKHNF